MAHFNSFRDYLKALQENGEIQEVQTEVDWNLEIGAIIRRINDMKGPALLFNKIKGYPQGYRILGSPAGASGKKGRYFARIALSLGMAPETPISEMVEYLAHLHEKPLLPPKVVATGPCKENIFKGEDVNLLKIPAPYLHEGDGGRYLGTWHIVITQTPDKKWTNWGMYRIMAHDEKSLGGLIVPTQHIGMHYAMWKEIGKPMPFAIALGTDPLTPIVASMAIPDGINEADVIGGLRGEPLEVVKCETVDLYVPHNAEIVIEGTISIDQTRLEGPFGEYTGFMTSSRKEQPIFQVSAVTHRNDPILPVVCPGEPVDDHLCMSVSLAADALAVLRKNNLPVIMTHIPPIAALHLLVVSVDKKAYPGDIIQAIGKAIWSTKIGTLLPKIMVVDKDLDPTDLNKVVWTFCTKCHPQKGVVFFPDNAIFPLSPYLYPEEKKNRKCTTVIFDCTWPDDWSTDYIPKRGSFDSLWPKEIQDKVLRNWREYGFKDAY